MGVMSDFDLQLQIVSEAMADQPPDTQLEYRLDRLISELDELCGMARKNPADFERHLIAAGQVVSRAQLFAGFLLGRPYPSVRIVGRG